MGARGDEPSDSIATWTHRLLVQYISANAPAYAYTQTLLPVHLLEGRKVAAVAFRPVFSSNWIVQQFDVFSLRECLPATLID